MKIYDISQEVFSSQIYPGDPCPERQVVFSMENGNLFNLTAFSMCAHNGTHVDAPNHFIKDGKSVSEIPLKKTVGFCYVTEHDGILSLEDAERTLKTAADSNPESAKRILFKGDCVITVEAARYFAQNNLLLVGVESQTVGPSEAPMDVHKTLLNSETVLLEGVRLSSVPKGVYFLNAAPLNLKGSDGSPCRAVLIEF